MRQRQWGEYFANPFRQGTATHKAEGHIRPHHKAQLIQPLFRYGIAVQFIHASQHCCRVCACAPKAGLGGDMLFKAYVCALAGLLHEQLCGLYGGVVFRQRDITAKAYFIPGLNIYLIVQRYGAHNSPKVMIAVGALS